MSKLTDVCASVGLHNGWQFAKGRVMIVYVPSQGSGAWRENAKWQVVKGSDRTDDEPERSYWRNRGMKTFPIWSHKASVTKASELEAAKAWASERYGITEWARTPYGDWMDASFVSVRIAQIKAQAKVVSEVTT